MTRDQLQSLIFGHAIYLQHANKIKSIFAALRANPELAAGITYIYTDSLFSGVFAEELDFAILPNIETIRINNLLLTQPPTFSGCKKLRYIRLVNCGLSEVPEHSECLSLKILDLRSNPLSTQALTLAISTMAQKLGTSVIISDAWIKVPSNINRNNLTHLTMPELVELFALAVDKPDKNYLDVADVTVIALEFNNRWLAYNLKLNLPEIAQYLLNYFNNSAVDGELIQLREKAISDSLFRSKLNVLQQFCDKLTREKMDIIFQDYNPNCAMDAEVWLPDFSFMAYLPAVQLPLGKPRAAGYVLPFPKQMLLPMQIEYWEKDLECAFGMRGVKYFTPAEKKPLKVRLTNQAYILTREIDAGKILPARAYLYVLSPNGGLYLSDEPDLHHSCIRSGQYLMCAGEIIVDNFGKIISINDNSGHMLPPFKNLLCAGIWLNAQGYIDEKCLLIHYMTQACISVADLKTHKDERIRDQQALQFVNQVLAGNHAKPQKRFTL